MTVTTPLAPVSSSTLDTMIDTATAAVLAQKYEYTPKHLRRMQREKPRVWSEARHEIQIALTTVLGSTAAPTSPPVIGEFQNEHRFLSNFWPYDGTDVSKTAEHVYQAAKTVDPRERELIMAAEKPHAAKLLGDDCTLRPDWEDIKVETMDEIIQFKFRYPALRAQLLATGSAVLIEGNHWCDTFWGCCSCPIHQGAGMNWLGIILMETRNNLRQESRIP